MLGGVHRVFHRHLMEAIRRSANGEARRRFPTKSRDRMHRRAEGALEKPEKPEEPEGRLRALEPGKKDDAA